MTFGLVLLIISLVIFISELVIIPLIDFIKLIPKIMKEFWRLLEIISPIFPLYNVILLSWSALLIIGFPFMVCFYKIRNLYLSKKNLKKHGEYLKKYCNDIEDVDLLDRTESAIKYQIENLNKLKKKRKREIIKVYEECLKIIDYKRGKL